MKPGGQWPPRHGSWNGIDPVMLEEAGVVVHGDGRVTIPYRLPDRTVHRWRLIAANGRRTWSRGNELIPFGLEALPASEVAHSAVVFIAEGESDALALRQHAAAIEYADGRVVDAYAVGLPGAAVWRPGWAEYLTPFPLAYLVGDGDGAGRAMNARVRGDLPHARTLELADGDDARAIVQRPSGRDELAALIDRADRDARLLEAFERFDGIEDAQAFLAGTPPRVESLRAA